MIGLVVGDLIGSTWEHSSEKTKKTLPCISSTSFFTDETILSIATIHAIMHSSPFDDAYNTFFDLFGGIPAERKGFPPVSFDIDFITWVLSCKKEQKAYDSKDSTSAIKAAPIGWYVNSEEEAIAMAETVTKITNSHHSVITAAKAIALAIYLAQKTQNKELVLSTIADKFQYIYSLDIDELHRTSTYNSSCEHVLPHALSCIYHAHSFREAMTNALYIGGDTDNICAIVGAIAEPLWGVPIEWAQKAIDELREKAPLMAGTLIEFEKRMGSWVNSDIKLNEKKSWFRKIVDKIK